MSDEASNNRISLIFNIKIDVVCRKWNHIVCCQITLFSKPDQITDTVCWFERSRCVHQNVAYFLLIKVVTGVIQRGQQGTQP